MICPGTMDHSTLQDQWTSIYGYKLPTLSKCRDPIQPQWPVVLDHCFARIILDNAVGIDRPWAEVVKAPAIKNMSAEQLRAAINLGWEIITGVKDLVELNERSLTLRGKTSNVGRKRKAGAGNNADVRNGVVKKSRKGEMADIWASFKPADVVGGKTIVTPSAMPTQDTNQNAVSNPEYNPSPSQGLLAQTTHEHPDHSESSALTNIRARIATDRSMTPFRQRVLTLLTQVPRGRYTTYKALSEAISSTPPSRTTTKAASAAATLPRVHLTKAPVPAKYSCARAVGSAMRNNPFAPTVPCHRVLAADGKIGGFGGDWGDDGRFAAEKRKLLREEGVKFDGKGKVVGPVFVDFV